MLLGKRPRNPMKRTTSLSEITLDLNTSTNVEPRHTPYIGGFNGFLDQNNRVMMATDLPRIQRRHSANCVQDTPNDFLRSCSLCKRPLIPGHDIYMYRGDSGFCSLECRQQQMKRDERKVDKYLVASKKQVVPPSPSRSQGQTVTNL
ncbi:putative Zf-FLZ domain-containing protein [Lupinus albus]|uniref:Putative Zf-FLZ domain-containing protein n=1 Tax=Lupinus albus TaxID=3870 RepID=A0A6A4PWJ6_LUPAL|nr:putative Zf-FLZ domain-containing protein [Lupinus albus]